MSAKVYRIPFKLNRVAEEEIQENRIRRRRNFFYACCGITNFATPKVGLNKGRCVQGNNCIHGTHKDSLKYAFDFDLDIGTPVVAAKDGVVVACCKKYTQGGVLKVLKARSNFIVLRHGDNTYTRYYHLKYDGVVVNAGDHVVEGEIIGYSGNTGFSTGPHLHFDCVDTCNLETSVFELVFDDKDSFKEQKLHALKTKYYHEKQLQNLPDIYYRSCCAGFSSILPLKDQNITGPIVWAKPDNAYKELENNPDEIKHSIVLVNRCKDVDFIDKCRFVQKAGGIAMIVVNYEDGPTIHSMARGKSYVENEINIPAIMICKSYGELLNKVLFDTDVVNDRIYSNDHVNVDNVNIIKEEELEKDTKKTMKKNIGDENDAACNNLSNANKLIRGRIYISDFFRYNTAKEEIGGPYASMTLPIKFKRYYNGGDIVKKSKNEKKSFYVPKTGFIPPSDVLWPLDGIDENE
eukprot:g2377.t1